MVIPIHETSTILHFQAMVALINFSTAFMETLNKQGYAVIGLNAKEYFWNKKTPQEAANAIESAITESNKQWKKKILY